jgi:hypothetical protein
MFNFLLSCVFRSLYSVYCLCVNVSIIKFYENPSNGSRIGGYGYTDKNTRDEITDRRFSRLRKSA